MSEQATELEWLKWFYAHADFGPAEGEVRHALRQQFKNRSGKALPDGYDFVDEEESA